MMREEIDVEEVVEEAMEDIMSHGAWCGHCYNFEYLLDSYTNIIKVMKDLDIDTAEIEKAYNDAVAEYKKIETSDTLSFLYGEDTEALDELDDDFFQKMIEAVELVSDYAQKEGQ